MSSSNLSGHRIKILISSADGQEVPCRIKKADANTYECVYIPQVPGNYVINVTYGGQHVPRSPFKVAVGPFKESRIRAYGPGLIGGVVGYPAIFTVETNGETGALGKHGLSPKPRQPWDLH